MNGQVPCPSAGVSQKHPSCRSPGIKVLTGLMRVGLVTCSSPPAACLPCTTSLLTPGSPAPDPLSAAAFGGTQMETSDGKCQHLWAYRLF